MYALGIMDVEVSNHFRKSTTYTKEIPYLYGMKNVPSYELLNEANVTIHIPIEYVRDHDKIFQILGSLGIDEHTTRAIRSSFEAIDMELDDQTCYDSIIDVIQLHTSRRTSYDERERLEKNEHIHEVSANALANRLSIVYETLNSGLFDSHIIHHYNPMLDQKEELTTIENSIEAKQINDEIKITNFLSLKTFLQKWTRCSCSKAYEKNS